MQGYGQEAAVPTYEQTIFISYAWGGASEEIVDQIDQSLAARGIRITRDKRDLSYKGSIQNFMERIGQGNCVIVVISDKYLRSPNCMFELAEIADNKQFHDRIFPIVLADADIYDPVKRVGYVKYWEDKRNELASAMKAVDPANLQGIREDIDLYDRIRDKVSGLASTLKDMNTLTPDMHREADFRELYDAIEQRMKDGPAESAAGQEGHANPAKQRPGPGSNVTATDGSIGIGGIQIGGDVSGNIVIGNNNQVNKE
jgi:internalin A